MERLEDPRQPEFVGPCAECCGELARMEFDAAVYNVKHNESAFASSDDANDWENVFCRELVAMAAWCQCRAESNTRRGDTDDCEMHKRTKEDDE